jgi:hypothetical protein
MPVIASRPALKSAKPHSQWITGIHSPGIKRPECKAEVKNAMPLLPYTPPYHCVQAQGMISTITFNYFDYKIKLPSCCNTVLQRNNERKGCIGFEVLIAVTMSCVFLYKFYDVSEENSASIFSVED